LIGLNRVGKTFGKTLLNLVRPASGSARLFGIETRDATARRAIVYLPENLNVVRHSGTGLARAFLAGIEDDRTQLASA